MKYKEKIGVYTLKGRALHNFKIMQWNFLAKRRMRILRRQVKLAQADKNHIAKIPTLPIHPDFELKQTQLFS